MVKAKSVVVLRGNNHQVPQLKVDINVLLDKEATMWAQLSRLLWVRHGDRNKKYFHSCATKRCSKNLIVCIRDEQDTWRVQSEEIATVMLSYYKDLFLSSKPANSTNVLPCVPSVITDEMNDPLCCALLKVKYMRHYNKWHLSKHMDQMGCHHFFTKIFGVQLTMM